MGRRWDRWDHCSPPGSCPCPRPSAPTEQLSHTGQAHSRRGPARSCRSHRPARRPGGTHGAASCWGFVPFLHCPSRVSEAPALPSSCPDRRATESSQTRASPQRGQDLEGDTGGKSPRPLKTAGEGPRRPGTGSVLPGGQAKVSDKQSHKSLWVQWHRQSCCPEPGPSRAHRCSQKPPPPFMVLRAQ